MGCPCFLAPCALQRTKTTTQLEAKTSTWHNTTTNHQQICQTLTHTANNKTTNRWTPKMILKKNHSQVTPLDVFLKEVQVLAVSAVGAPATVAIAVDIAEGTPQIRCLLLAEAMGGTTTAAVAAAGTLRASSYFWEFVAHAAFLCSFTSCAESSAASVANLITKFLTKALTTQNTIQNTTRPVAKNQLSSLIITCHRSLATHPRDPLWATPDPLWATQAPLLQACTLVWVIQA